VFAFFGQITPFKGVDVLLRAYGHLSDEIRKQIEVRVYGENKYWRGGEFQQRVNVLLGETNGGVRMLGAYRNDDVIRLMRECDFVVVPSVWWENSPVVIQEAKLAGARIICSDIGGMSEKTEAGTDFRFPAGNAPALASLIEDIATSRSAQGAKRHGEVRRSDVASAQGAAVDATIELYGSALNETRSLPGNVRTGWGLAPAMAASRQPA
jgi:glycosyltransferase involved in cell wall biosynthesis